MEKDGCTTEEKRQTRSGGHRQRGLTIEGIKRGHQQRANDRGHQQRASTEGTKGRRATRFGQAGREEKGNEGENGEADAFEGRLAGRRSGYYHARFAVMAQWP